MFSSPTDRRRIVNRATLAALLDVALPTIDSFVGRGCPFVARGAKGREWEFDVAAVVKWLRDRDVRAAIDSRRVNAEPGDRLLDDILARLDHVDEIEGARKPPVMTLADASKMTGRPVDLLLHWIKAGAPYVTAGDWQTGKGFRVNLAHLIDWSLLIHHAVAAAERDGGGLDHDGRRYATALRVQREE